MDAQEAAFLAELEALPRSFDGPDGSRAEPYGLMAFGEAAVLPAVLRHWIDAPLVSDGTQFLLAGGFDFGELGPLKVAAELAGADVVTLGAPDTEPSLRVPAGPLALYSYASYLGHATGHGAAVEEMERLLTAIRDRCRPGLPTEINPAKAMAWTTWNRVPLLLAGRLDAGLPQLVQRVFARVGKSLSITAGDHPLELVTGALEGNHALGDDLLALLLGEEDPEMRLVSEVLATRVAQVERLDLGQFGPEGVPADPCARAMAIWYFTLWIASYLALLHGQDAGASSVYDEVRKASQEP